MSSDSSDENHVNDNDRRSLEYQNCEWDKEKKSEIAQNRTKFEERTRNKFDWERDDCSRSIPSDKKALTFEINMDKLKTHKLARERDELDVIQFRGKQLNEVIEKKVNNSLQELLSSQPDKKISRKKSIKSLFLSEDELIEQKVRSRLDEIDEKKRKEEEKEYLLKEIAKNKTENKNDLQEMEKRITKMFQETIQQHKQQFWKENENEIQFSLPNDKKAFVTKSIKTELLSEEELIEQKVKARLTQIEEKKLKEEEKEKLLQEIAKNKNDLMEMDKRMSNMFLQSKQQHKQQFEQEKDDESQLNPYHDKKASVTKSFKTELLNEDELIEQKVQARLAEIEEKKRNKEEKENLLKDIAKNKTDLLEMEKRMANMLQQGLQQQKQQFEREKEALIEQTKQALTLKEKRLNAQSSNKLNKTNDFYDPTSHSSLSPKFNRPEADFSTSIGGDFKILLLGGSGTGKSTLINTISNYFLGGSLKHPKVVIPTKYFRNTESGYSSQHSESNLDDGTLSKTTNCKTYTFFHPENRSLKFSFIDSPGLSDTGGTKQDDLNLDDIINTAINARALSAIIVIANGTESRVTPSIMNTLVRLGNNLPDEVINRNLILILTKCWKVSATFELDFFANKILRPKEIFYMDNQAFCSDPRTWQMDENAYEALVLNWKQSQRTFDNLLKTITEMSKTSTIAFKNMKELRNKLKSEIATICQEIANIQKVQDNLEAAQIAAKKFGDDKDSFANYTKSETITLKKIIPASFHSTVCTTHLLKDIICHQQCGLEFTSGSGSDYFTHCLCMGDNNVCTKCECGPHSHYHDKVALETVTETIEKVLEDMKAQYDAADADYQKFNIDLNNFQTTLDGLQADVDKKYQSIHQLCYDLKKICARFNFVDELHANIENMKLEARIIKNADIRQNAENEVAKLVKLANDLTANQAYIGSTSSSHSSVSNTSNINSHSTENSHRFGQKLTNALNINNWFR